MLKFKREKTVELPDYASYVLRQKIRKDNWLSSTIFYTRSLNVYWRSVRLLWRLEFS